MVRLLLGSLMSATVASGYLADLVVPQEEIKSMGRWDALHDVFDKILQDNGFDEETLGGLPKWLVSHHNVTMSDGVNINTLVVNPPELKRRGAIVSRSPYGMLGSSAVSLVFLVLNGYTAVIQDQRGTQGSEGVFDMWTGESQDSTDIAEWISKQLWSNGDVYYVGGSADGMPGNMAVLGDPKRLKGEWLIWTAENGHSFSYPQGAYRQDLMRGYLTGEAGDTHGASRDLVLPKVESKEAYDPWWESITLCRDQSNPSETCYYNKINWPIVDSVGWWDLFQHTHITHWKGIRTLSDESVRDKHVLVVGPLGHCIGGASPKDQPIFAAEEANGLLVAAEIASELFAGKFDGKVLSKVGRVNLFVMGSFHADGIVSGGNYWTSLDELPNPEPTKLFLGAQGSLEKQAPMEAAQQQYVYDPSAEDGATPMFGGNNLPGIGGIDVCGSADQMPKVNRSDILIFDSQALSVETPMVGDFSALLFVSSSAKDTDFFVTVEDLAPNKQKSMLVRYGMARMRWRDGDEVMSAPLEPDQVYPIEISLWTSAYVFPKGHSVRVTISSAAYPYYDANPNTGNALYTPGDQPVAATNAIHISPEYPSSVSLPVVSALDIPKNTAFVPSVPPVVV